MSEIGDLLIESMKEAVDHIEGRQTGVRETVVDVQVPDRIDVAAIRKSLGLSRAKFASLFGFSIRTLEKWELGERCPEGPTRAYLLVISREPAAVKRALEAA